MAAAQWPPRGLSLMRTDERIAEPAIRRKLPSACVFLLEAQAVHQWRSPLPPSFFHLDDGNVLRRHPGHSLVGSRRWVHSLAGSIVIGSITEIQPSSIAFAPWGGFSGCILLLIVPRRPLLPAYKEADKFARAREVVPFAAHGMKK